MALEQGRALEAEEDGGAAVGGMPQAMAAEAGGGTAVKVGRRRAPQAWGRAAEAGGGAAAVKAGRRAVEAEDGSAKAFGGEWAAVLVGLALPVPTGVAVEE